MKTNQDLEKLRNKINEDIKPLQQLLCNYKGKYSDLTEFTEFTENLYDYIKHQKQFSSCIKSYNLEFFTALKNTVNAYNCGKGDFINYFCVAYKREIGKLQEKEYVDDIRAGIHLPDNKLRKIKTMKKLLAVSGKDITNIETRKWLAVMMKCSVEEVNNLIKIDSQKRTENVVENDDGETADMLENMCNAEEQSIDETVIKCISNKEILDKIDKLEKQFSELHKAIITHCLSMKFDDATLGRYRFFSAAEYEKCCKTKRNQKDVTDEYGADKSSYNQYLNRLVQKIKK